MTKKFNLILIAGIFFCFQVLSMESGKGPEAVISPANDKLKAYIKMDEYNQTAHFMVIGEGLKSRYPAQSYMTHDDDKKISTIVYSVKFDFDNESYLITYRKEHNYRHEFQGKENKSIYTRGDSTEFEECMRNIFPISLNAQECQDAFSAGTLEYYFKAQDMELVRMFHNPQRNTQKEESFGIRVSYASSSSWSGNTTSYVEIHHPHGWNTCFPVEVAIQVERYDDRAKRLTMNVLLALSIEGKKYAFFDEHEMDYRYKNSRQTIMPTENSNMVRLVSTPIYQINNCERLIKSEATEHFEICDLAGDPVSEQGLICIQHVRENGGITHTLRACIKCVQTNKGITIMPDDFEQPFERDVVSYTVGGQAASSKKCGKWKIKGAKTLPSFEPGSCLPSEFNQYIEEIDEEDY